MAEFRFSNDLNPSQTGQVMDVLRRPRLWVPTERDYPDHDQWLQKVEGQIATGDKRAMVAFSCGKAVGTVIYQRHQESPNVLEVRNISVSPDSSGRYVGSFLLRNSEIEGAQHDFPGVDHVMVDAKLSNIKMGHFLLAHGYGLHEVTDLYGVGAGLDAVFVKPLASESPIPSEVEW